MTGKKITTEKFIAKAKKVHGNKYDYSLVKYVDNVTKVIIICPIHGKFKIRPTNHTVRKHGCLKCGYEKTVKGNTLTTEKFIARAEEVHGDKYDYSLTKYVTSCSKVIIICHIHGKFEIIASNHVSGKRGCPKCAYEKLSKASALTTEEFISRARKIHGDKYDYSLSKYVNAHTKVIIICPIHGEFEQVPAYHVHINGCPKCAYERISKESALTTEEFISNAKEVHGDDYDYSLVKYVNAHKKVPIICKIHGIFKQTPHSHVCRVSGCPTCKTTKGERLVERWLSKHKIKFTPQYTFYGCKSKRLLRFDFYLPKLNMCIEYDGPHHYRPVKFNSKMSDEQARKNFEATKLNDKRKNEYCDHNNIRMKRVSYKDLDRIDDVLNIYVR